MSTGFSDFQEVMPDMGAGARMLRCIPIYVSGDSSSYSDIAEIKLTNDNGVLYMDYSGICMMPPTMQFVDEQLNENEKNTLAKWSRQKQIAAVFHMMASNSPFVYETDE